MIRSITSILALSLLPSCASIPENGSRAGTSLTNAAQADATPAIPPSEEPAIATSQRQSLLNRFKSSPSRFLEAPVAKYDAKGQRVWDTPTSRSKIAELQTLKQEQRRHYILCPDRPDRKDLTHCDQESTTDGVSRSPGSREWRDFVDNGSTAVSTLEEMATRSLTSARLEHLPWIIEPTPTAHQPDSQPISAAHADRLSAMEKWNIVLGDKSKSQQSGGDAGFHYGWAPASFTLPNPLRSVEIVNAAGAGVTFSPADIRTLGVLMFARAHYSPRVLGGHCIDASCVSFGPEIWHQALINQVGVSKRGLVMSAQNDLQIENQPVVQYSYRYFHPQTMELTPTLSAAKADKGFSGDYFRGFRSTEASQIVGIVMDVHYAVANATSRYSIAKDHRPHDHFHRVTYLYDLEIAKSGKIVGGQWYTQSHPDLLWTPPAVMITKEGTVPFRIIGTSDSVATEKWDGRGALPQSWKNAALNDGKKGQLLAKLVYLLFDLAKSEDWRPPRLRTIRGHNLSGAAECPPLPDEASCPNVEDPVTAVCRTASGKPLYCSDCSVICDRQISVTETIASSGRGRTTQWCDGHLTDAGGQILYRRSDGSTYGVAIDSRFYPFLEGRIERWITREGEDAAVRACVTFDGTVDRARIVVVAARRRFS